MNDQPTFEADYVEKRSRLTTFFRLLLAIPPAIVVWLYAIVAYFALIIAWFAIVITGRYPEGLYNFIAGFNKLSTALYGYTGLLTDAYPPFTPDDADNYPVRLQIGPPLPRYSRLLTFFRGLLAIPVFIIMYAMQIVWELGSLIAWFVIVVIGKQPKGLQDMIVLGLSYQQRAYCYILLLTEKWPAFTAASGGSLNAPAGGGGLPASSAFGTPEAPRGATGPSSGSSGLSGGDPLAG
jgi:Domain of unknown function (DUF4389)